MAASAVSNEHPDQQMAGEGLPVDGETTAWALSLAVHMAGLLLLAWITTLIPSPERTVLTAIPPDLEQETLPEEFRFSDEMQEAIGALADSGSAEAEAVAPLEADISEVVIPIEATTLLGEVQAFEISQPLLESPIIDDRTPSKGVGSVGATGAAGAIDRLTNEILLSIDQRPTLVIWLFDQSGSLQAQREEVAARFDRVYDELGVIQAATNEAFDREEDKPLLTAVAQFGTGVSLLTPDPIDDVDKIKAAVRAVKPEDQGRENVFRAVGTMAEKFKGYRLRKPRRNVMIVAFTDEAGDDIQFLDPTVSLCRKLQMPVYVVGVPAPFGRRQAYVKYVDPDPQYDQTPIRVAVDQGPESLYPERIKLAFIGGGDDNETMDSGFGPFGLTRLAYETGGAYFTVHPNRRVGRRVGGRETEAMATYMSRFFDSRLMRRYRPDYVTTAEYTQKLARNRARAALVKAAAFSQTAALDRVQTVFEKQDEAQFSESLSRAQRAAAKLEPEVIKLTNVLRTGESDRRKLKELRWQAGYDLAMGRALAAKVRTEGYNAMLARAKQGMAFENEKSDTWIIRPSDQVTSDSVLAKEAAQAKVYLDRVVSEHDGTPWALLAQQELATPFGWEWREEFRDVAGRRARQQANANSPRPQNNVPLKKQRRPAPKL